jgi:mannose-6-phosphate isomerase-like protein (cupin superfamily)
MPWKQTCKIIGVTGPSDAIALDVNGVDHAENGRLNDGSHETVYVVISGFGVLCSEDVELECTAGDVLFVPRGFPHRFDRLDGDIRIWSISPVLP